MSIFKSVLVHFKQISDIDDLKIQLGMVENMNFRLILKIDG